MSGLLHHNWLGVHGQASEINQPAAEILRCAQLPPAKGPFEVVLWEKCCYLLPDETQASWRQQITLSCRVELCPKGLPPSQSPR